jgi:hypothetical protein
MDVAPTPRERVAQLIRLFGSPLHGERVNAWRLLEQVMKSEGLIWTDIGNWVEQPLTEDETKEMFEFAMKEATRQAQAQLHNGHIMLPDPSEMAEFCHQRLNQLKDNKQREFIGDMCLITRRGMNLSRGRLGYLASIYIQIGGRI